MNEKDFPNFPNATEVIRLTSTKELEIQYRYITSFLVDIQTKILTAIKSAEYEIFIRISNAIKKEYYYLFTDFLDKKNFKYSIQEREEQEGDYHDFRDYLVIKWDKEVKVK